jgi:hypothetical protein
MNLKEFFKDVWLALNPWRYDEVPDRTGKETFRYFFGFLFLMFVIALLLFIPAIASFVGNFMDHFEVLELKANTTMKSALLIPEERPMVTIDTRISEGELTEGKVLITDDYVYSKKPWSSKVVRSPVGDYNDLLENQWFLTLLLIMLLPAMLFLFYILYAIKALLIILLATLVAFIVARLSRFEVSFADGFKCGLLAATPMIIIDMLTVPFRLNTYGAPYIAFAIFFIVGFIKAGNFEGHSRSRPSRHKSKRGRGGGKGGYIELKVPRE